MTEENKAIDMKNINLYKIGFFILLIILAFFLGVLSHSRFIKADWPLGKDATCIMMNVTGASCDAIWCDVIDCNYNSTKEACICIFNNVTYINNTINQTIILNNESYCNISSFNYSLVIIEAKAYADNQTMTLRDSLTERIDEEKEMTDNRIISLSSSENSNSSFPWYGWVISIIVIFIGLGFLAYQSTTKKKLPEASQVRKSFSRKINEAFGKKEEDEPKIKKRDVEPEEEEEKPEESKE